MPRYFFDMVPPSGKRVDDQDGVVLPTDEDAQVYAVQVVSELNRDEPQQYIGWALEVRRDKRVVAIIPFQKVH